MLLAFMGVAVLEHTLSEEEHSQIVQTIEMFEVITQTHPDDYQSLEILKEAYQKIGKPEDSLTASRRLAEAYFNAGSYTLAMQECEVDSAQGTERARNPGHARRDRDPFAGGRSCRSRNDGAKNGLIARLSVTAHRLADRHR